MTLISRPWTRDPLPLNRSHLLIVNSVMNLWIDSTGKIKVLVMPSLNATEGPHNTIARGALYIQIIMVYSLLLHSKIMDASIAVIPGSHTCYLDTH